MGAVALAVVALAACARSGASGVTGPTASAGPDASASAVIPSAATSPGGDALSTTELKLRLVDRLGPRWYCDPDEYPIARGDEMTSMRERWPEVVKDDGTLAAILAHERLPSDPSSLTDAQRLIAYRLWKVVRSIALDPAASGTYRFDYLAQPASGSSDGTRTTGTIDGRGAMTIATQAPAGPPMCPICLARGTPLDTPSGSIRVEALAIGDQVWTLDAAGRRIPGEVLALGAIPAPAGHRVIHLVLADGREVTASPGHPLPDGRVLGDLRVGDLVDGTRVVLAASEAYASDRTFDLVVSGPTGIYLSDGIPLASTLR